MSPSDDAERRFNTAYSNSRMGYIFEAKVALNFARFEVERSNVRITRAVIHGPQRTDELMAVVIFKFAHEVTRLSIGS